MPIVHVAAAALVDSQGRILLAQRPAGKDMAGLWEFPGGKIEPGETPEACLIRELAEELGIQVALEALEPLHFVSHAYARFHLVMLLYGIRHWQGAPRGLEAQGLAWVEAGLLTDYPMPPADLPLLAPLHAWLGSVEK